MCTPAWLSKYPPYCLGTGLTHYINVFIHTDRYKESKHIAEEKKEIELELQAARKKLAEEMEQHGQCRREFAETHREYMRKY